jgi:hypothetical protein
MTTPLGYVRVYRRTWEHAMFRDEPYTRREAWLWLISEAAWKPTQVRIWPIPGRAGVVINLERGQVAHAERFLAEKWGWSRSKVRRFIRDLTSERMVSRATAQPAAQAISVLTICKYDEYQPDRSDDGPASDNETAQPAARDPAQSKRTERTERTEIGVESIGPELTLFGVNANAGTELPSGPPAAPKPAKVPAVQDDWPVDYGEQFWVRYPPGRKSGKKAVLAKLATIRKNREVTFARLMDGLSRYVESMPDPKYTKGPLVWLNQGCWDDEPPPASQRGRELTMADIARGNF